jgi:hypothetical protein
VSGHFSTAGHGSEKYRTYARVKGRAGIFVSEMGEPVSALIDKALEELQEQLCAGRAKEEQARHPTEAVPKPI